MIKGELTPNTGPRPVLGSQRPPTRFDARTLTPPHRGRTRCEPRPARGPFLWATGKRHQWFFFAFSAFFAAKIETLWQHFSARSNRLKKPPSRKTARRARWP